MEQTVDFGNVTISSDAASETYSSWDLLGLIHRRFGSLLFVKSMLLMLKCWKLHKSASWTPSHRPCFFNNWYKSDGNGSSPGWVWLDIPAIFSTTSFPKLKRDSISKLVQQKSMGNCDNGVVRGHDPVHGHDFIQHRVEVEKATTRHWIFPFMLFSSLMSHAVIS